MATGYLSDVSVLLPYENGGQVRQLIEGVLATTGANAAGCKLVWVDQNNVKWVASDYPYSLFKIVNNVVTTAATWETMDYGIGGMCIDKNNTVWVVDPGGWCVYPIVDGVKGTAVGTSGLGNANMPFGICSDKDGALWVVKPDTMAANKVVKIVNNVVTALYDLELGAKGICCDRNNVIYVANSESASITKIEGGIATNITVADCPTELCVDKNNALWALHVHYETSVTKLSKIVNGSVEKLISTGFANGSQGICSDNDNVIWVGDPQGCTLTKVVNDSVAGTVPITADLIGINGDATGMQAAILFEGGSAELPIVLVNQAMSGGV